MKRLLSVIMCAFLLAGLFSCGNGNDTLSGDTEEPKKPEQTTGEYVSSVFEGVVIFPDEGEIKNNKISPEEAIEIAREKFEYPPDREGATGTVIAYSIKVLNNPNRFYHVVLQAQRYERDTYYAGGEPYRTTYEKELFISLTVNHEDLTNIEEGFAEMIGCLSVGDTAGAQITKSRLIDSLEHLGRLSGFNFDAII